MAKIGILGEIRSGKDTFTELLIEEMGYNAVTLAFSTGIHKVIDEYMPELYEQGKPRQALQGIGQLFREYKPDVWIDRLFNSQDYKYAEKHNLNMIITDVRQLNEVERLKKEGFLLIKVTADRQVRLDRMNAEGDSFTIDMLDHETETQVRRATAHCQVNNSGTLEDLKKQAEGIVSLFNLKEVADHE